MKILSSSPVMLVTGLAFIWLSYIIVKRQYRLRHRTKLCPWCGRYFEDGWTMAEHISSRHAGSTTDAR